MIARERLTGQQRAVLEALKQQSPCPTTILRDVRAPYGYQRKMSRIGEPVGNVLRRLEKRGLVTGEMGRDCKDWWISDAGLSALDSNPRERGEGATEVAAMLMALTNMRLGQVREVPRHGC